MRFHFIQTHSDTYAVAEMCECLEVSPSGYYVWRERAPSVRSLEDELLKERIVELHKRSKRRYGYRPIYHHLQEQSFDCGRDRTRRLMNDLGIEGLQKKRLQAAGHQQQPQFRLQPELAA